MCVCVCVGCGCVITLTREPDVEGAVIAHLSLFSWSKCSVTLLVAHVSTHTHTHNAYHTLVLFLEQVSGHVSTIVSNTV